MALCYFLAVQAGLLGIVLFGIERNGWVKASLSLFRRFFDFCFRSVRARDVCPPCRVCTFWVRKLKTRKSAPTNTAIAGKRTVPARLILSESGDARTSSGWLSRVRVPPPSSVLGVGSPLSHQPFLHIFFRVSVKRGISLAHGTATDVKIGHLPCVYIRLECRSRGASGVSLNE